MLLIPGIQLSRIYADDPLFPRKGYSATFDIHGGIKSPLTETTFLHTSIRRAFSAASYSAQPVVVAGRYRRDPGSHIFRPAAFSAVLCRWRPERSRLWLSGPEPEKQRWRCDRRPISGGREHRGGLSVLSEILVWRRFFDAGNAGDNFLPSLKKGVGIGLRYRSPVGMIRLDVAHPLDDPADGFRIHISIGADL